MFCCAGQSEIFSFAEPIGIGLIQSSIHLTQRVLLDRPEVIIFVGSAGSYGKHPIGDIIYSSQASQIEHSFLHQTVYTPIDNVVAIEMENVPRETIINSSNYITQSKTEAEKFLKLNISLENMEFYSVLSVAKTFEIPAFGIFGITNYCYENAHEEFKINHASIMAKLQHHIEKRYLHS